MKTEDFINGKKYRGGEINRLIPNQFPLMFMDSIEIDGESKAVGRKVLKEDDWFFKCHYPGNPMMPGCLMVEMLMQVFSATFLAKTVALRDESDAAVLPIPAWVGTGPIRFREKIVPGDTIEAEARLDSFRHGLAKGFVALYKIEGSERKEIVSFECTSMLPK